MATKNITLSKLDLETTCKEIHDSFTSLNPKTHLAKSLASYSKIERKAIRETYKFMYGDDVAAKFVPLKLNGYENVGTRVFADALYLWMLDQHERDVIAAREAIELEEPNYLALVEMLVGRKSSHVLLVKQAYRVRFRRQLDQDIVNLEPPHPYQKILIALATSHTAHEQVDASQHIAKCDARRLYEAGEGGSAGNEEAVVLEILSKRSIPQMKLTISIYKHIYGHDYAKSVKRRNSREFGYALASVIKCICYPHNYYAKVLYRSIKGTTCDKGALLRVLMSKAETTDMDDIKRIFKNKFRTELKDAIHENIPSPDYRDFLLVLADKCSS